MFRVEVTEMVKGQAYNVKIINDVTDAILDEADISANSIQDAEDAVLNAFRKSVNSN